MDAMTLEQQTQREMRYASVLEDFRKMLLVCNGVASLEEYSRLNWAPFFTYWKGRCSCTVVIVGRRFGPFARATTTGGFDWSFGACWPEELADYRHHDDVHLVRIDPLDEHKQATI